MAGTAKITTQTLEDYREYLTFLARARIGAHYQAQISASDVVQETLFDAHRKRGHFRGSTEAEVVAWLRCVLANRLTDAFRAVCRDKRDIARERSLNETLDDSHTRLENFLIAVESSPSVKAMRSERLVRLTRALAELRESQRQAIECKYLHGLTVQETARTLQTTTAAVAGLLRRGLARLRELLTEPEGL